MDLFAIGQIKLAGGNRVDLCKLFGETLPVLKRLPEDEALRLAAERLQQTLQATMVDLSDEERGWLIHGRPAPVEDYEDQQQEEIAPDDGPADAEAEAADSSSSEAALPEGSISGTVSMSELWNYQLQRGLDGLAVDEEEQETWVTAYLNLESALRLARQLFEAGDPRLVSNIKALADAAGRLRLQDISEALYREAITSARRHPHADQLSIPLLRLSMAVMYAQFEQFKQAKKIIDEETAAGNAAELPANIVAELAKVRQQIKIYESVQALLRQAQSAEEADDIAKAARLSNTALSQLRQGFPPHHPEQARVLRYRARLLQGMGQEQQAEELAQRAERIERSNDGLCDQWSKITEELPRPQLEGVAV